MSKKPVLSECRSHIGYQYTVNEDAYTAAPAEGFWIIADGMGGHSNGSVASNLVVDIISEQLRRNIPLATAVQNSHKAILLAGEKESFKRGMGSTVVALKLDLESHNYEIAAVGDSRAYLFSNHHLQQITSDHTLVQELINQGIITYEQARIHPNRNILRQALGSINHQEVCVDIFLGHLNKGDILLLCSDGLTNRIQDLKLATLLQESSSLGDAGDNLIKTALVLGGQDNVTVALIQRV